MFPQSLSGFFHNFWFISHEYLQTQEKSLYPKLLHLLRPFSTPKSATLLGWHAEGPFIELSKRGAHAPPFLLSAPEGMKSFDNIYGKENLIDTEDWLMASEDQRDPGVRIITAAPEIDGVMESVGELSKRGIVFSIGHRFVISQPFLCGPLLRCLHIASQALMLPQPLYNMEQG